MYDVLIIGAGPAGISASLYAKRANLNVLVLYHGKSNLEDASQIDNYYGFSKGISGENLYNNGIEQAKNLGIEVKEEEVLSIEQIDDGFKVVTTKNEYKTKTIIISTGNKKLKPNIIGINEFEGKGISYCAICDGFFYRNKNVCVIGNGNFAISEAKELSNIANKVTILTNGLEMQNDGEIINDKIVQAHSNEEKEININLEKIKAIAGEEKVNSIEFENGEKLDIDGIFVALGEAGGADFAKKLGIIMNEDNIKVNENMETNIPGIFACGNITGGLLQVSKAVYEGAKAGLQAVLYVRQIK